MFPIETLEQIEDFRRLPPVLRKLLNEELAAGNMVVEVFHSFPAPPAGACFRLSRPLITRSPGTNDGLDYRERNSSLSSGEITDDQRIYFLVEPALPPEPELDMNAIRDRANFGLKEPLMISVAKSTSADVSLLERFKSSMVMDFEKWHDGIGYEVELLPQMSVGERYEVERLILAKPTIGWFDVEALAILNTPAAQDRLMLAIRDPDYSIRNAVQRYAPELVSVSVRTFSLVKALRETKLYGGLTQALHEAEEFHPPEVIQALLEGARDRDGETATLMAAMLFYVHGFSDNAFDLAERPFFLRFNTTDLHERAKVFAELQERIESHQRGH